jgi:hypothetical protein
MYCHGNAGEHDNLLIVNKSLKNMAKFKFLGKTLTNKIAFPKKLRADCFWGMLAALQFRIF